MTSCLLGLVLSAGLGAEPEPPRPGVVVLFAAEDWYKKAGGAEKAFEGTIELNPSGGQIGKPSRFNSYRLAWTDTDGVRHTRELYAPGKAQFLAVHVGKRLRVVGKAVDAKVDDKVYAELWPARLETLGAVSPDLQSGIIARCGWQPAQARRQGASTWVVTSGLELARHRGYFGTEVDAKATADIARELGVPALDWNKQMLVSVAAGLRVNGERLRILHVTLKDKVLTITYRLEHPPDAVAGLCYPAETVLVDRFNGDVRFVEDKGAVKPESR